MEDRTYLFDDYEIFDGEEFRDFEGISVSEQEVFKVVAEKSSIEVTSDHRFMMENGEWVECSDLKIGDVLLHVGKVLSVTPLNEKKKVYDPVNVEGDSYLSNEFLSHNCNLLYLDEFGHVPRNVQSDFMASVYPTITSGKNSKIIVTSTPNGFDLFHKIYSQAETGVNGYTIVNAHWTDIPGRDEAWKQDQINHLGSEEKFMQEFDAMFLGSAKTLISPHKLASLVPREPIEKNENTRIYEAPKKGHTYIISLDSSEGIGLDYHAAQIIDVTTTPYVQVGIFHTNKLRYTSVPSFIDFLSKKYNDAFILIELNSTGMEISNLLSHDLENENLLSTQTKKGKQILGMGFGVGSKFGLKASVATKSTGCMSLKTLIEKDHLIINDKETIEELFCYVSAKRGFQGDGRNDDTVSALVNFSWASSQESFENLVDPKVREKLLEEAEKEAEEDLSFFGFITDGTEDDEQFSDLDGMRGEVQKDFSSLFGFSTA